MNKRFFTITAVLLTVFTLFTACISVKPVARDPNAVYELVILHTNDHHGNLVAIKENNKPDRAGLALRSTYIKNVREKNKNVLLLDAGDINTGSAASNMFKAEPDILAYNMMNYDAVTFGNHEFDTDIALIEKQLKLAEFPWISANILRSNGKPLGDGMYKVKEYEGFRVGIFGLTTSLTSILASPDESLTFTNEIEAAQKMVDQLRNKEKCDIVIALGHLGDVLEKNNQITSIILAENVSGIDLIVDGHSHSYMESPKMVNGTPIVSANEWGKFMGTGIMRIKDGKIVDFSWRAVPITSENLTPDPEITSMLKPYLDKAEADLSSVVMTTTDKFEFGNRLSRYREIALGDMVSDATMWYLRKKMHQDVDFAITNGGNIRTELPAGSVTKGNIATVLPFDNWIFVLTMKGSDLIELFDFIGSINQGSGGFAQVSKEARYTITYDGTGKNGKISNVTLDGKPIDLNKMYKVATNDYIAKGGDGYDVLKKAVETFNTSVTLRDLTIEYVQQLPQPVDPAAIPDGRITITGGINP